MSSTMKPVMSQGSKTPPVSSQMSKQMHPQAIPTTFSQPISHMPQNLINVPHNPNVHSNVHSIAHHVNTNIAAHTTNHYSLNVPNASQHYPISGNPPATTHPAHPSAHSHPVGQGVSHTTGSYSTPPKTSMYESSYQASQGHQFEKTPNLLLVQNNSLPQSATTTTPQPLHESDAENVLSEKQHHSNGTQENNVQKEPKPNHMQLTAKDKSQPSSQTEKPFTTPEKKEEVSETASPLVEKEKEPSALITTSVVSEQRTELNLVKPNDSSNSSSVSNESEPSEKEAPVSVPETTSSVIETLSTTPASSEIAEISPKQVSPENESKKEEVKESSGEEAKNVTTNKEQAPVPASSQQTNQKTPTLKLATTSRISSRKSKSKVESAETPKSSSKNDKSPTHRSPGSITKAKRNRIRTQHYQSPLPEVEMISKMTSSNTPKGRNSEDRLIIFYKNEFLAVRNLEGGFYVCQAVQNIYKSSPKIRIRWLSQDKNDKSAEIYTPDFYDYTDFDCILTNLNLERIEKGKFRLPPKEKERTDSILKRALAVEKGDSKLPSLTEEHPDGLDLSLYKEESQLKKRKPTKRKATSPLKSPVKSKTTVKKSPEKPKVPKVSPKPKKVTPKPAVEKKIVTTENKKTVATTSRAERAKRRQQEAKPMINASSTSNKGNAVVDSKKAKVLAKVARKKVPVTVPASKVIKTVAKVSKSASSKSQKPAQKQRQQHQQQQQTQTQSLMQVRKSKRGKK